MKTIVIGYSESGVSKILLGLDEPERKKAQLVHEAKRLHTFPKGIVRVDHCTIEVCETAIFVGDETTKQAKAAEEARQKREQELAKAHEEKLQHAGNVKNAEMQLRSIAAKRNDALSKLASLKTRRQHELDHGRIAEAEKLTKEIAESQATADALIEHFKSTLVLVEVLKNPQSTKEEISKALETLKTAQKVDAKKPEEKK